MQGKKLAKKTFQTLTKVVLYLCLFIAVGIASYKITLYFEDGSQQNTTTKSSTSTSGVSASVDSVAQNLVLAVDEDSAEVQSIVLEVFNTTTHNIDLVTIPASTKVTMSQELYSKLVEVNANIPQIITLTNIGKYFDQSVAYEYATLILNEYLNTTISFYSAMLTDDFDTYFTSQSDGTYTFNEELLTELKGYTTDQEVLEKLMEYYDDLQSNLLLSERKTYIPNYLEANYDYIHTYLIEENYEDGAYTLSEDDQQLVSSIVAVDTTYTSDDYVANTTETASSIGLSIEILNGTSVAGLAATYQTTLESAGYTISAIGNYSGTTQYTTRIIVSDETYGADLEQYFNGATVEVGTIDGGYDILIILGSNDA